MKTTIHLIIAFHLMINPTITGAENEEYKMVSQNHKENILFTGRK